jgi:hypothetical protein
MVILFLIVSANANTSGSSSNCFCMIFEVCILMSLSSATMVQEIVASFVSLKCFAWQAILQCQMKVAHSWNVV